LKNAGLAVAVGGKDAGVAPEVRAKQSSGQHTLRLRSSACYCQSIHHRHRSSDFQVCFLHALRSLLLLPWTQRRRPALENGKCFLMKTTCRKFIAMCTANREVRISRLSECVFVGPF
jgi:hypothetical protein